MFVLDSSPIIYLAKAGLLEKLQLLGEFFLAKSVFLETVEKYSDPEEAGYIRKYVEKSIKSPSADYFSVCQGLSKADSESISLAKELSCAVIMDEKKGREIASLNGIENHGTVYLLLQMLKKNLITKEEFKTSLLKMVSEGFYLSAKTYEEIMNKLNLPQ